MSTKLVGCPESEIMKAEKDGTLRDVGSQAVWSLSSCKPGFGVDQLCDNTYDTYWQSDGPQPHLVNVQFRRKTLIHDVCVYADYKADESYTPNKVSVRAGNNFNDLLEIEQIELTEPQGWIRVMLKTQAGKPVKTFMIQVAILANHQNGRDTHVRRIKVRSPAHVTGVDIGFPEFKHIDCAQFSCIR